MGLCNSISKNDNITGSVGFNQFSFLNPGLTDQEQSATDLSGNQGPEIFTVLNSDSHIKVISTDWSLACKRSFKEKGHELDIWLSSSFGKPGSGYSQTEYLRGKSIPFNGSAGNNPGTDNEMEMSVDYTHPVNDNFLIETGLKTTYQNLTSIALVTTITAEDSVTSRIRELPFRSSGVSFRYKFGKIEANNKKKENENDLSVPEGN